MHCAFYRGKKTPLTELELDSILVERKPGSVCFLLTVPRLKKMLAQVSGCRPCIFFIDVLVPRSLDATFRARSCQST